MAREQIAGFPADGLAGGPGFGRDPAVAELVAWMYRSLPQPLVVDADALNLLALQPQRRSNWVLTPHPGEAARLRSPLAITIIGGLSLTTALTLFYTPLFYRIAHRIAAPGLDESQAGEA